MLGSIQGIMEWLPVSSEGLLVLAKVNFFGDDSSLRDMIRLALFLHFGTFLAALIYFHRDVKLLLKTCLDFHRAPEDHRKLLKFLTLSTLISGILGWSLLIGIEHIIADHPLPGKIITGLIGLLLIGTGFLQLKTPSQGLRATGDLTLKDSLLLGFAQGFAALPGFSRSGLTVSALLLCRFEKATALRLSFLMSLPIVLLANIILHYDDLSPSWNGGIALGSSFVFGLLTIHALLKLAQKVNFGKFLLFFGCLTLLAALL